MEELVDLATIVGMAEHRQAEGRLGDENIARLRLERRTSWIGPPLVIARDDDAAGAFLQHSLRAAENVSGRHELHANGAELHRLAIGQSLERAPGILAEALAHDRQRLRRRQHGTITGTRVVAMSMRDHRTLDRLHGIDEE